MTDPSLPKSSFPTNRLARVAFMAILLVIVVMSGGYAWYASYLNSPAPEQPDRSVIVVIPRGSSVKAIGTILGRAGVIVDDVRFLLLAKFSGYGTRLQAGEFSLPTGKKPLELLHILATAGPVQYAITIPEGLRASEIAGIFSEEGWVDKEQFLSLVGDSHLVKEMGLGNPKNLEGYLFPDTYNFTRETGGAQNIIGRMVSRFAVVWDELTAGMEETPDMEKTVILASIIEKETGAPEERGLIAGVFYNRLQRGMPLQSDPTVIYGTQKFGLPITREDLLSASPYNTYILPGLPAGPICNPGRDALAAALHPDTTPNLYFVARNDGTHQFSVSLAEHNRAVIKYQRKKTAKEGK